VLAPEGRVVRVLFASSNRPAGLGAQMADTAAAGIAALAGADVEVKPLRPVLRGVL
jgi:hypothetical protein